MKYMFMLCGALLVANPVAGQESAPLTTPSTPAAARPTDAQITDAIARGRKGEDKFGSARCYASGGFMNLDEHSLGFAVSMRGAIGRIALAAHDAKKNLKAFSAADVDDGMASGDITFYAMPDKPELQTKGLAPGWHSAPSATNLVIRPKVKDKSDKADAIGIQPEHTEPMPAEWSNALGGKFDGQGIMAVFDVSSLPEEFDVVVVTDVNHERSCSMKSSAVLAVKGTQR